MALTRLPAVDRPRRDLCRLATIATIVVAAFTVPTMLFGLVVLTDEDATAPSVSDVPVPEEWQRRELLTSWCSATGGEFCTFVVLTPPDEQTRSQAEAAYRAFVAGRGWRRGVHDGDQSFEAGAVGQETILIVGSDDADIYSTDTYGDPPAPSDILIEASFADLGRAHQRALGQKIIAAAAVITIAPTVIVLAVTLQRRRR